MNKINNIQEYIDHKLAIIANQLPDSVHENPASFACGFNTGYKSAMLDLERFLQEQDTE